MTPTPDLPAALLTAGYTIGMKVKGRVQVHVVNRKGRVISTRPWQDNLILDQGMNYIGNKNTWANMMSYCAAGTGTTPTRDLMDGTASQTLTTVTLAGSTYSFSGGDVGKWIGWASGQQAKITAYVSATQVTVDRSQTVGSGTATLYRAGRTGLATEVKRTNTYPNYTYTDGRGASASFGSSGSPPHVLTLRRTYDFTAEVGSVNYTEIGISPTATAGSNLFALILLSGTVTVASGQQLRITYELAITIAGTNRPVQTLTSSGGGWPYTYNIASISSTGSNFTVTFTAAHHYVTGGTFTITGAKRPRFAISAATSTGSDFTLTTTAPHGRSPGDSVIVEGMTPSGYNGTWTCASGTTGSTIIVTSVANPGTGTVFGNVRLAEPGTWYDSTLWTIASTTSTTVVVTSALNLGAAGADGTAKNSLNATLYLMGWPISPLGGPSGSYGVPVSPDTAAHWCTTFGSSTMWGGDTHGTGGSNGGDAVCDGTCTPGTAGFLQNIQLFGKSTAITPPASTFPNTSSFSPAGVTNYNATASTRQSYTNGTFYVDHIFEWSTAAGNAMDIRGWGLNPFGNSQAASTLVCGWFFDQPQRKDSTNRLRITFRNTWTRVFS